MPLRLLFATLLLVLAAASSAKSTKRGVCWDEKIMVLDSRHSALLSPGVSWVYNWGPDAACSSAYSENFSFEPMAWNGAYDASRIRAWLGSHPECRYLLGFNEPNFADQARMTPAEAAAAWPALEAIAEEYGVKLVAPALNFPASQVGGRLWNPYEWYDEFFRLYPGARADCLAMHCYMNWYSANTWLATEYFYTDLYTPGKDCYGRYPNLVKFLDSYRAANGRFPRMMLTEFCSWENDGAISGVDFQIDQMTQKVQKLEQSDLIEGYAWFMANTDGGATTYPYMSLLERNSADSGLSELGTVYVYMSDFDSECHYRPGESIAAKDYVDATTDERVVKVRRNTEPASDIPLQVEIPASGYTEYLIDVPADGEYAFTFHVKADAAGSLMLYVDNKKTATTTIDATGTGWVDVRLIATLTAGKHRIMPYNAGQASMLMNALSYEAAGDAGAIAVADIKDADITGIHDLSGHSLGVCSYTALSPGVYIVSFADGTSAKIKI